MMNSHIDYAPHSITVRNKMREMYNAANNRDLTTASKIALEALVELRLAINALKHLQDLENQRE